MDQDWSDSGLPWLDMVLLCLDGVGLMRVSWAVSYLYKPQWRAVTLYQHKADQVTFKQVKFNWGGIGKYI